MPLNGKMSTETPHRPHTGGTKEGQTASHETPPTVGKAGTIERAHRHAPEGASRQLIEDVAFQAMRQGRKAKDVWEERNTGAEPTTLTEFISNPGGGE